MEVGQIWERREGEPETGTAEFPKKVGEWEGRLGLASIQDTGSSSTNILQL